MSLLAQARVGDMIELKDFQSISDKEEDTIYTISRVSRILLEDQLLFTLFTLEYDQRQMFVILDAQVHEGQSGYRLYYSPFPQLSRRDWLEEGGQWLFLTPANLDHFNAGDLELAPVPAVPELEELGQMKRIAYHLLGEPFYAEEQEERAAPQPLMVAEYATSQTVLNPTMLLLERDWCDSRARAYPTGGILTLMVGGPIEESEMFYHPVRP